MISHKHDFFEAIRDFITVYLPKHKMSSHRTIKSYDLTLNLFLLFLYKKKGLRHKDMSFANMTYQTICGFLDWLQDEHHCGTNSRNHHLMVVRSFLKYAAILSVANVSRQIEIEKVPMKKVVKNIVEHFSLASLEAILAEPDRTKPNGYRDAVFMSLMYDAGARCQEVLDLRVRSLALDHGSPVIYLMGKGSKIRPVPIMKKTAQMLRIYLAKKLPFETRQEDDFLFFTTRQNRQCRMSESNVGDFVKRYGRQAKQHHPELDIPDIVHPHQFRHSRAMHLYADGIPINYISELLGHSKIESTQIYAYSDSEMKRRVLISARQLNPNDNDLDFDLDDEATLKKLYGLRH